MDAIRRHEVLDVIASPPSEKLERALLMMQSGIILQWSSLRHRFPDESEAEIDERLGKWLADDDQGRWTRGA